VLQQMLGTDEGDEKERGNGGIVEFRAGQLSSSRTTPSFILQTQKKKSSLMTMRCARDLFFVIRVDLAVRMKLHPLVFYTVSPPVSF
jgi:hypothetical protein